MLGEVNSVTAQQEAAALFRASLSLFEKWGVTDEQAAMLLGMELRVYRRWKGQGAASVLPSVMLDC
ncbi:antitoxin Xre-like helix-turn-helix domain-containing protein [Novosphingobium sp. ZN18A2]|uniref:antitoxin Xre-like helix-turn-helix domain-containing protein n=1 Tax=Novosphingobium sp. ZN18A2 TaxID=3079861 RepID=UPI0030D526BD